MKKLIGLLAVGLVGCGGVEPELYNLVVDTRAVPSSCYRDGNEPSTTYPSLPPFLIQVQVFDGPDGTSYLTVTEGGGTYPLGEAGSVSFSGVLEGGKPDGKGITFTTSTVSETSTGSDTTTTNSSTAQLVFPRGGGPLKGTASATASRKCVGSLCPNDYDISCSLSDLPLSGARIAVDWQRAP